MIKQYLRYENRKPFGVIIAVDRCHIGVSFCNSKDKWNKIIGEKIAIGRAMKESCSWKIRLEDMQLNKDLYITGRDAEKEALAYTQISLFLEKVPKYFKEAVVTE
jgi:hypothetical protein